MTFLDKALHWSITLKFEIKSSLCWYLFYDSRLDWGFLWDKHVSLSVSFQNYFQLHTFMSKNREKQFNTSFLCRFLLFFFLLKTNIFAESFWLLPLLNRFFCRQKNFIHKLFPAIVVFQRQIRCRKWFAAVSCAIIIIWFDIKIVRNQIIFKFISTSFNSISLSLTKFY